MTILINEWQLDVKLNKALHQHHRADFSLYLALLSPSIEESAEFLTPNAVKTEFYHDLYQELSVKPERDFAQQEQDIDIMTMQTKALTQSGLAQLKLMSYLNPAPLCSHNDKTYIDTPVWTNLSIHTKRKLQEGFATKDEANPAALYEVLESLHAKVA